LSSHLIEKEYVKYYEDAKKKDWTDE